ncbi:MAG: hypothetical protein GYB66_12760 [Chloroflexi bacterium]|nr:hypothetical protein [Chloroflexota bacterium]
MNRPQSASPHLGIDFRSNDLQEVFGYVHAGQSIEIIGVGNVGKSNFIQRILRRDVQDRYLYEAYQERAHCLFIHLDANSLLEPFPSAMDPNTPSGWPGYELMASRLLRAIMENNIVNHITNTNDPAHPESLYGMYRRLWPDSGNDRVHIVAFRYLEDLIHRIFAGANYPIRLIFIFDEFEKLLNELPIRFFQSLRSLRDQYKDRVLYITTARQILPLLVPEAHHHLYEPFSELFTNSRHFLLPYGPSDTQQTFNRLAARRDLEAPPASLREQLLAVTGGHGGLVRAGFAAWAPTRLLDDQMTDQEVVATMLDIPAVQEECKTIWASLSNDEREVLFEMVRARQDNRAIAIKPFGAISRLLIHKGLLLQTNSMAFENIRPLVFAAFLLSAIPPEAQNAAAMPSFPSNPIIWS